MADSKENSASPPKVGDRPHLWTVVVSTAALTVSVISYMEAHRSRLMNEELSRPLVRAISVDLSGPILPKEKFQGPKMENGYTLTLRNTGKAFATNVQIEMKAQIDDTRIGPGIVKFSAFQDATILSETIGDLAPEDEYKRTFWALVLKDPPTIPFGDSKVSMVSLYVKGQTIYTNPLNHAQYKQPFCFVDSGTMGQFKRCGSNDPH